MFVSVEIHGNYPACRGEECSYQKECANHTSAGDYRTEDGLTPDLGGMGSIWVCNRCPKPTGQGAVFVDGTYVNEEIKEEIKEETMRKISTAVVVIRKNTNGQIEVLLQFKRKFMEWEFPGGKLDGAETIVECAQRELYEETSIEAIKPKQLFYVDHGDTFGCVIFLVTEWRGLPALAEPDKQSGMGWFTLDALPKPLTKCAEISLEAGCLTSLEGLI